MDTDCFHLVEVKQGGEKPMTHGQFMKKAIEIVAKRDEVEEDKVFTVWSAKTIQNSKTLMASHNHSGQQDYYYEITLNGDRQEIYVDTYKKLRKETISFK